MALNLDARAVAGDLSDDGVAVVGAGSADPAFLGALTASVAEASTGVAAPAGGGGEVGGLGVVVVDQTPAALSELRDAAREIADAAGPAGRHTVVVRAPGGVGAVSSEHPRSQLDQAGTAMAVEPDYPASVAAFAEKLGPAPAGSWAMVAVTGVVVLVVAAVAAARSARAGLRLSV